MAELIDAVVSWPSLVLVLVVFGFAPGLCLRLITLMYPRDHPRRAELIAELYAVPRIERPLWVAEQLEVALFEGLAHRISAALRQLTNQRQKKKKKHTIASGSTADLLGRARDGDAQAWKEIVDRYNGVVSATTRSFLLQDADVGNAMQMTWIRLVKHCDQVKDPERLAEWLATAARRECLHILRQQGRHN